MGIIADINELITWLKPKHKWALGIALVTPLIVIMLLGMGALNWLELSAYDHFAQSNRSRTEAPKEVAVVLIDEASLQAMNPIVGRWPWPREIYAELLAFLQMGEPAAVAFDILFTENQGYDEQGGVSMSDMLFAEATAMSGNVIHAQQILRDEQDEYNKDLLNQELPEDFRARFSVPGYEDEAASPANNYYLPFPELYEAAAGMGVVEFASDPDGVYRRSAPLRKYQDDYFPVLGLAPVMMKLGAESVERTRGGLRLGETEIPLWPDGRYLINMYGKYETYSISGLLASMQSIARGDIENLIVDPYEFEDKIVFIGASAVGIEDLKHTAMGQNMPGVMLHASMAGNILTGDFMRPPSRTTTVVLCFLFGALSTICVLFYRDNLIKIGIPLAVLTGYYMTVDMSFAEGLLFEPTPPTLSLLLSFGGAFVYLSMTEGRERRRVRQMLGQYVSPHMLATLVDNREGLLKAEVGMKEYVTILFSDIRGFTTISEGETPERIVSMLNRYFTLWSDDIFRYDGTIDKFVGDAVMALWGAPIRTDNHPEQAVRAALGLLQRLPALNRQLEAEGFPEIKVGIGIHTGYAILGNIGSERKLDYTVIGDAVNLASRIEGLTKQYGCDILLSDETYGKVKDIFPCTYVDEVNVKGKAKAVKVYKVEGGSHV